MGFNFNPLPVQSCTKTELYALATLENIEKGLRKTWFKESAIMSLLQQYGNVSPWTGSIESMGFTYRNTRSSVATSVDCRDPFPLPGRRKGLKIKVKPNLYVDGIDSCVLDELNNRGSGVVFNELAEEMKAFKEDWGAMLNAVIVHGDGQAAPKHIDTADFHVDAFAGPGMATTFNRGTGFGLLSILGDETLRPEYLSLSGADDECEFWRAGIYDAEELSALDPSDPSYWNGEFTPAWLLGRLERRRTPGSKYVAITDPLTYITLYEALLARSEIANMNAGRLVTGQVADPVSNFGVIEYGGVLITSDEYWPKNSIGVFDFSEIELRYIPEFWMKNTGWQAAFNTPLQKFLWEMSMFAVYTRRRNAHMLICNPTIPSLCSPVSVCNPGEIGVVAP